MFSPRSCLEPAIITSRAHEGQIGARRSRIQPVLTVEGGPMVSLLDERDHLLITPPHGIEQVVSTFGDIFAYINEDHTLNPAWQADHLVAVPIPFALALSWDHSRRVQRVTCHKLLQPVFEKAFV